MTGVVQVHLRGPIPQEIREFSVCKNARQAAAKLRALVNDVQRTQVDDESKYKSMDLYKNNWAKVTTWASGGGKPEFFPSAYVYRFKNQGHADFFEGLFRAVETLGPARCSRNNLFHGHAVFDPGHGDLRIVFHAFEYPADRQPTNWANARELDPSLKQFKFSDDEYYKRNLIWSSKSHSLFRLDCKQFGADENHHCYPWVEWEGVRLEQSRIGEQLVTFNYFPVENVRLFLTV